MLVSSATVTFLIGTTAYLGIRAWFQRQLAGRGQASSHGSAVDRALIGLVILGQIVLPLLAIASPLLHWADYDVSLAATVTGAALMTAGVWLFSRSHADLGRNWSVGLTLASGHQLVTTGVYRWLRHPMYASFFVMAVAQLLLVHNAVAGPAALLAVTVLYTVRRPREEAMMSEHFGPAYTEYVARTGGVWPRLGGGD